MGHRCVYGTHIRHQGDDFGQLFNFTLNSESIPITTYCTPYEA